MATLIQIDEHKTELNLDHVVSITHSGENGEYRTVVTIDRKTHTVMPDFVQDFDAAVEASKA